MRENWQKKFFDPVFYNPATPAARKAAPAEAAFAVRALGLKKGARVLDVACGPGRHCMEFARRGLSATGIDFCSAYLAQARAEAAKRGLKAAFLKGDMRALPFREEFDGAVCMFTSFGYFSRAEDFRVLRGIARALRPGGKFLLDVVDGERMPASTAPRCWSEAETGFLLEESSIDMKKLVLRSRWIFLRRGQPARERRFRLNLYTKASLAGALSKAGFKVLEFRNDFGDRRGGRLLALAVKI